MDSDDGPRCGEPTRSGTPCRARPLGGGGGKCHEHANLPLTPAERRAAQTNAVKHGFFLNAYRDEKETALHEQIRTGEVDEAAQRREALAALAVRARRMVAWESEEDNPPSPLTAVALGQWIKALDATPGAGRGQDATSALDEVELVQRVEALLEKDSELVVRRLPKGVQDLVRAALREAKGSTADVPA